MALQQQAYDPHAAAPTPAATKSAQDYFPISEISTYNRTWTICARVTNKSPIRTFTKGNGSGKVFSVDLLDAHQGEIRASFFGDIEGEFEKLQVGQCYTFARGNAKIADRRFNQIKHRYELVFDNKTADIKQVADHNQIQAVLLTITSINSLKDKTLPCNVDLCGILTNFGPVVSFTSNAGKNLVKREITIVDDSLASLIITLWGDRAQQENSTFEGNPVVALKGVYVNEFQQSRAGSLLQSGSFITKPTNVPEAERVQLWWTNGGSEHSFTALSAMASFGLTSLKSVQDKTLPCNVDLCGIVSSFGPAVSFTSNAGKSLVKREIVVTDESALSLSVTLWGERAQQDDKEFEGNPVVSLKGVMIKEWQQGRSGQLMQNGTLVLRPTNMPAAEKLQRWWSEGGSKQTVTALSVAGGSGERRAMTGRPVDLADLRTATESLESGAEYFTVYCRLAMVQTRKRDERQPLTYMACQEPKEGNGFPCNRRVDSAGFCASCNRNGKTAPRFNARCRFSDFADSAWLTTFHEGAQRVLQMSAEDCHQLDQGDDSAREIALKDHYFARPLQVSVRAKMEMYNNEMRSNIACLDARPVSQGDRGRAMLAEIDKMLGRA